MIYIPLPPSGGKVVNGLLGFQNTQGATPTIIIIALYSEPLLGSGCNRTHLTDTTGQPMRRGLLPGSVVGMLLGIFKSKMPSTDPTEIEDTLLVSNGYGEEARRPQSQIPKF